MITGASSFQKSEQWTRLASSIPGDANLLDFSTSGEPTPEFIDEVVRLSRREQPDVVVSAGGGSAIDAGKAVAAMLMEQGRITEFLEGVGVRKPSGKRLPFFAVPTTAGTGAEATKNAVITSVGEGGFKKSLRHENFVPDRAYVDPLLSLECPREVTAASGMDAVTQLLEAFASTLASPASDALARSGMAAAAAGLIRAVEEGTDVEARSLMAYAAYMSGIVLANAGLGIVHGLASPIGALLGAPHGAVCGTLLAAATKRVIANLRAGRKLAPTDHFLTKYAEAGTILSGRDAGGIEDNCDLLIDTLETWTTGLALPRLNSLGLESEHINTLASEAGLKNSPARLSEGEIAGILSERM